MSEGYPTSADLRTSYIKPYKKAWQPIVYAAVDGLAIFDGCIILGTVDEMEVTAGRIRGNPQMLFDADAQIFGSAIKGAKYLWPNKTIPFVIDKNFINKDPIRSAIKHWQTNTPIRFVERDPNNRAHNDYIVFRQVTSGCASAVGRQGGKQEIILAPNCHEGNVIHEIGHTVGLWHEQSRADRDDWIEIFWQNIHPLARPNFEQHVQDGIDIGPYNYGSVMHYPEDSFPREHGLVTIKPKRPGVQIGQRNGLSVGDVATVKELYP